MKALLLCLALVVGTSWTTVETSPPDFEGRITFSFEYMNVPAHMQDYINQMSQGMIVTAKGPRSRMEQTGGSGPQQIVVSNYATSESFVLMDLFGVKIALIGDPKAAAAEEEKFGNVQIDYPGDTKNIAGYNCEKAVITIPGAANSAEVWVTSEFKSYESRYNDLKGYPLEYTLIEQGFQLKATAISVDTSPVDESTFDIPSGYEPMTEAAFQQFMESFGQ